MRNTIVVLIAVVLIAILFYLSRNKLKKIMENLPLGMGLNNPTNITIQWKDPVKRIGKILWTGEIDGKHPFLKSFKDLNWGFRAGFVNLDGYFRKGINTLKKIFEVYAPAGEFKDPVSGKPLPKNDPTAYIKFASTRLGVAPTTILNWGDPVLKRKLVALIARMEQGKEPDLATLEKGYQLYLNPNAKI